MRRIVVAAMLIVTAGGQALAQPRAVLELFTSQGCSSCPPADRMMGKWAQDPSLIALSLPVDYWDYLGWKDTLARHDFSLRQRAYSDARGDPSVYTPQVIVDGVLHAVGSKEDQVERAIEAAAAKADILTVPLSIASSGNGYTLSIGGSTVKGEVWVVPVQRLAQVAIERGENTGKTVAYSNVARGMRKIADYDGSATKLTIRPADYTAPGADSFAVLLQASKDGKPGAILGAAMQKR